MQHRNKPVWVTIAEIREESNVAFSSGSQLGAGCPACPPVQLIVVRLPGPGLEYVVLRGR